MELKIPFYIMAAISVISAIFVVGARNLFHAVLSLGLFLLSIASIYILLGAEFIAIVQVLIFIGGVVVLFLFTVMLTPGIGNITIPQTNKQRIPAFIIAGIVLFLLISFIEKSKLAKREFVSASLSEIASLLLNNYVLAFEVISILLLTAIFGAIVLTKRKE